MKYFLIFLMCVSLVGCASVGQVAKLQAELQTATATQEKTSGIFNKNFQQVSNALNGFQSRTGEIVKRADETDKKITALEARADKYETGLGAAEVRVKAVEDEMKNIPYTPLASKNDTVPHDQIYVQDTETSKNGITPVEKISACEGKGCGAVQSQVEQPKAQANNSSGQVR